MGLLHKLVLEHHEVHQDVADGGHGVLGAHHLKLGIVNDVKWFCHISIIFSFSLKSYIKLIKYKYREYFQIPIPVHPATSCSCQTRSSDKRGRCTKYLGSSCQVEFVGTSPQLLDDKGLVIKTSGCQELSGRFKLFIVF